MSQEGLRRQWVEGLARKKLHMGKPSVSKDWKDQEALVSESMPEGKLVPGSGCSHRHNRRGDVTSSLWVSESKTTSKKSIRIERAWVDKIRVDADAVNKRPSLVFGFDGDGSVDRDDWVAFPRFDAKIMAAAVHALLMGDYKEAGELARMLER